MIRPVPEWSWKKSYKPVRSVSSGAPERRVRAPTGKQPPRPRRARPRPAGAPPAPCQRSRAPPTSADHIFHFMCDSWGNIETLAALWLDEKYTLKEPAGCERAIRSCIPVENVGKYCIMGVENCHPSARSLNSDKNCRVFVFDENDLLFYVGWRQ